MLTRRSVRHQYGQHPQAVPPYHAPGPAHAAPSAQAVPRSRVGGLTGGAVQLDPRGWVGVRRGWTGYGYLGMDPSDPSTWIRPFNPAVGMIAYLNGVAR